VAKSLGKVLEIFRASPFNAFPFRVVKGHLEALLIVWTHQRIGMLPEPITLAGEQIGHLLPVGLDGRVMVSISAQASFGGGQRTFVHLYDMPGRYDV